MLRDKSYETAGLVLDKLRSELQAAGLQGEVNRLEGLEITSHYTAGLVLRIVQTMNSQLPAAVREWRELAIRNLTAVLQRTRTPEAA